MCPFPWGAPAFLDRELGCLRCLFAVEVLSGVVLGRFQPRAPSQPDDCGVVLQVAVGSSRLLGGADRCRGGVEVSVDLEAAHVADVIRGIFGVQSRYRDIIRS